MRLWQFAVWGGRARGPRTPTATLKCFHFLPESLSDRLTFFPPKQRPGHATVRRQRCGLSPCHATCAMPFARVTVTHRQKSIQFETNKPRFISTLVCFHSSLYSPVFEGTRQAVSPKVSRQPIYLPTLPDTDKG